MNIRAVEPFSTIDYPGQLAAVVFTQGCNMRCPYCHNSSLLPMYSQDLLPEEDVLKDLIERSRLMTAVVVTGGEPTMQSGLVRFLDDVKRSTKMLVKLDTNGSNPSHVGVLIALGLVDYVALDVKAVDAEGYMALGAGADGFAKMMQTRQLLESVSIAYELRTTCDTRYVSDENIRLLAQLTGDGRAKHFLQKPAGTDVDVHALAKAGGRLQPR